MVMLAEQYDYVIGGDPDRDTIDLAILDTATSRLHGQTSDHADGPAYLRMLAWAVAAAPGRRVWALEGTGSFAAGWPPCWLRPAKTSSRSRTRSAAEGRRATGSTPSKRREPH